MLIIILLPGMFIILGAIVFEMRNMGKINRQLLLGVTLPKEAFGLEEVKSIQGAYLKRIKQFTWISFLSIILFITLFKQKVSIQLLYFIGWTTLMSITPMFIHLPYYKKLKELKAREGWFVGNTEEILIDTKLTSIKDKLGISQKWFYMLLVFPILSIIINVLGTTEKQAGTIFIGIQLGTMLLIIVSNYLIRKLRTKVYSKNTEINAAINGMQKKNLAWILLLGGVSSGIIIILTQLYTFQMIICSNVVFTLFIGVISIFQIGIIIFLYQRTRCYIEKISDMDEEKRIVDEDSYWINGQIYYNPKDPKILVSKRIGIGSSMNMGNPKSKVLSIIIGIFIAIVMIYSIGTIIVLDFSTPQISVTPLKEVRIDYPMYNEKFKIGDINEIKLLEELPPTSKTNGVSTDEYARGYFTMKGYGQVKGYWYNDSSPYIVILLDKRVVVIGEDTKEGTLRLYEELRKQMD